MKKKGLDRKVQKVGDIEFERIFVDILDDKGDVACIAHEIEEILDVPGNHGRLHIEVWREISNKKSVAQRNEEAKKYLAEFLGKKKCTAKVPKSRSIAS